MVDSNVVPARTGVFLRMLTRAKYGTPQQAAAKASSHGVSWVALMALGVIGSPARPRAQSVQILADYAAAFREAGIDVWIWFYPLATDPEAVALAAGRALRACQGRGLILDVERPYRGRAAACRRLVSASLDELREDQGIAVTSYPLVRFHEVMPWDEMVAGTGMPQTYTITPANARIAVDQWRARGHTSIVPIGPAFGPNSGIKLRRYLESAYLDAGTPTVDGIGIWSWPQMSLREWKTIEAIASWW